MPQLKSGHVLRPLLLNHSALNHSALNQGSKPASLTSGLASGLASGLNPSVVLNLHSQPVLSTSVLNPSVVLYQHSQLQRSHSTAFVVLRVVSTYAGRRIC